MCTPNGYPSIRLLPMWHKVLLHQRSGAPCVQQNTSDLGPFHQLATNHLKTSYAFTTIHSGLTWATNCHVPSSPAVVTAYPFPVGFVWDISSSSAAPCNSLVHPLWWIHLSCDLSQLLGLKIVLSQLSCLSA